MNKADLISRIIKAETEPEAKILAEWIIEQQVEEKIAFTNCLKDLLYSTEKNLEKLIFPQYHERSNKRD